jgi:ribosome recycling factor
MLEKIATEKLTQVESRMKKSVEALQKELGAVRTGRATPSLVEHLMVDYYGTPTPLQQLASITAPEARLLVIQPWDKTALPQIEKAILRSDLSLNPANDGNVIRLAIPPLTQERRQELVRLVRKRLEEARVSVRNIRRDGLDEIRTMEKEKQLSQDDSRRLQERLQRVTDQYVALVDDVGKKKEAELLEL